MKRFIKYIAVVFILIGVYTNNVFGFVRKNENVHFEYDYLDVLAIGNSNLYSALSPQQLYKQFQYKSIIFASANQTVDETYQLLCSTLAVKKPKYVLWDIDNLFSQYNPRDFSIKTNINKKNGKTQDLKYLNDRPEYLNQYGYMSSEVMVPSIIGQNQSKYQLLDSTIQYFDSIVKTCQKNKVQLVLTSVPNLDSWSLDKYQKVKQLSSQYQIEYWDMNKDHLAHINWLTDTRDGGIHLNNNGAYKTTMLFGENFQKLNNKNLESEKEKEWK